MTEGGYCLNSDCHIVIKVKGKGIGRGSGLVYLYGTTI